MLDIVIRLVIIAVAVIVAVKLVPGAAFTGEIWKLILVAAVIGVVNAYIRPIVKLLALPLSLLTFGLVGLVINTAMVMVATAISDNLDLGLTMGGWPPGEIGLDTILAAFLTAL